jgi:hypothetical protein
LLGIIEVSLPLWLLIGWKWRFNIKAWHPLRVALIFAMVAVLFVMGVVVSTKIGGGGDLHNLDAYIVALIVVGSYLWFDRFIPDNVEAVPVTTLPTPLIALVLLVPIWFTLQSGGPISGYDQVQVTRVLSNLQTITSDAVAHGGEVLFISQRQLLIFHAIQGVPLIPEYENITLMEMAMSKNQAYLDRFYQDIRRKRFAVIISPKNPTAVKKDDSPLAEENDAWVKRISIPLLQNYREQRMFKGIGIQVLVPTH